MDILTIAIIGVVGLLTTFLTVWIATWRKLVGADEVHIIIQSKRMRVMTTHPEFIDKLREQGYEVPGMSSYYKIPQLVPKWGMRVHVVPLTILSITIEDFKAFDKDRARFLCKIIAYVVVNDPITTAKRFSGSLTHLEEDVREIVRATVRDATTKEPIREIINNRDAIINKVHDPLAEGIANWGLELRNIELVEFSNPEDSHVINDISSIIEEEIHSDARQKNAEQRKKAKIKEAQEEEISEKRVIEKEQVVEIARQKKLQEVALKEKQVKEHQLEVNRVEAVKTQAIEKERAIVEAEERKATAIIQANQKKEQEAIMREQKQLEGEGDKLRLTEQAEGKANEQAIPIKRKGEAEADAIKAKLLAEAEGKEKLQEALNKFDDKAIRALTAELIVTKDKEVGVAVAKALEKADVNLFSGTAGGDGFNLGQFIESVRASSGTTADSLTHRLAKPNDLGGGVPVRTEKKKKAKHTRGDYQ